MAKLSLANNPDKAQMTNTGSKQFAKMKMIDSIQTADPFKTLFPVNEELLNVIAEDIQINSFDSSQALLVWKEKNVLLDGHTRLQAAKIAGIAQVPVIEKAFESENEALQYAIHLQRDRRNLEDGELYKCILALDNKQGQGGDRKSEKIKSSTDLLIGDEPSRERTARLVGTSGAKVQRARAIEQHGSEEVKKKIQSGEISINKGYQMTQSERNKTASKKPALSKPAKAKAETARPPLSLSETLSQSIETIKQNNYQRKKALEQLVADLNFRQHITEAEMQELLEIVRK